MNGVVREGDGKRQQHSGSTSVGAGRLAPVERVEEVSGDGMALRGDAVAHDTKARQYVLICERAIGPPSSSPGSPYTL